MIKIDTHQHFWRYSPEQYDWIGDTMSSIRRDFLPNDLEAEIELARIDGVISVQARQSLEETWDLLKFADENSFVRAVVGWAPLVSPDLNRMLDTFASHPKLRAVRHVLQDEPDPMYMLGDYFNRGIAALKPYRLAYDILIYERHLPQTIQFVDRHPEQVFVLDHLGKPSVRSGAISPWRENIEELAKRPNVYCKISGLATEANHDTWTEIELKPYLDVVIHAFTPRRLMFGSDWPVCKVATSYLKWLNLVAVTVRHFSQAEQERFWSGTAIEAYRLN